jgi:fructokinase
VQEKYDVTALGELLIDFIQVGFSEQGNPLYEANPGGAPCNVLAMLQKLGRKTAFIGKVGRDGFGRQLTKAIQEAGVNTEGLVYDEAVHTTLSLVHKLPDGDRDFSFYRNPGADINLKAEEIREDLIRRSAIFHFGSLSLTDEPVKSATLKAMQIAEKNGLIRSFDPNLRPPLWHSLEDAKKEIDWGMRHCDLLKISDNEIQWFTGKQDFDEGIQILRNDYPQIKLICLSLGPNGSRAYWKDIKVEEPAFLQKTTIDTTGAGDTFCACMLDSVLSIGLEHLDKVQLQNMLIRANAAASIVTTRKGALRVVPEPHEIERVINGRTKEGYKTR